MNGALELPVEALLGREVGAVPALAGDPELLLRDGPLVEDVGVPRDRERAKVKRGHRKPVRAPSRRVEPIRIRQRPGPRRERVAHLIGGEPVELPEGVEHIRRARLSGAERVDDRAGSVREGVRSARLGEVSRVLWHEGFLFWSQVARRARARRISFRRRARVSPRRARPRNSGKSGRERATQSTGANVRDSPDLARRTAGHPHISL